jgi:hypothetical protein
VAQDGPVLVGVGETAPPRWPGRLRPAGITVTLDRPDSPRVAHALELLTDELNATPAHLPGDHRPLTYQLAQP